MNLQELYTQIETLRLSINEHMNFKNLYLLTKIVPTQFLAPRLKLFLLKQLSIDETSTYFCFSSAEDPNMCQVSFHKPWTTLTFAWIQPEGTYVFSIPKEDLWKFNPHINHADADMISNNRLFKHSVRFSKESINTLTEYLVRIEE